MTSSSLPVPPVESKVRVSRKVADLKPHPRQADFFSSLSAAEIDELAADIEKNGLKCPIEILPDGTVVKGHQRLLAVMKLGWSEVDVYVRQDLAGDKTATLRELLEDNLTRRQLSTLALARAYRALDNLPGVRCQDGMSKVRPLSPKQMFAARTGLSERNVARYLDAARASVEVQRALEAKRLTLVAASMVAHLPAEQQEAIAEAIRNGDEPRKVVEAYFRTKPGAQKCLADDYKTLLKAVRTQITPLNDKLEQVPVGGKRGQEVIQDLRAASDILARLPILWTASRACGGQIG